MITKSIKLKQSKWLSSDDCHDFNIVPKYVYESLCRVWNQQDNSNMPKCIIMAFQFGQTYGRTLVVEKLYF